MKKLSLALLFGLVVVNAILLGMQLECIRARSADMGINLPGDPPIKSRLGEIPPATPQKAESDQDLSDSPRLIVADRRRLIHGNLRPPTDEFPTTELSTSKPIDYIRAENIAGIEYADTYPPKRNDDGSIEIGPTPEYEAFIRRRAKEIMEIGVDRYLERKKQSRGHTRD